MQLDEALRHRRSVRHFRPDPVPEEHVREIVRAACFAPSACNRASWEVVVVADPERRKELSRAAINQTFIAEAPVVLAFVGGNVVDVSAAIQNALLKAHELGYEGCWTGSMDREEVGRILGLPEGVKVHYLVPIGRPAEMPFDPGKRSPAEVLHFERYGKRREGQGEEALSELRADTERALDEFFRAHEQARREAEATGYPDPLYRMEEKGAAFCFQQLVCRWLKVWEEWLKERLPQAGELAFRSREVYDAYWRGRSELLRRGDINDPDLVAHERKFAVEEFPKVLREWLKATSERAR